MNPRQVVSAQANLRAAQVKPRSGGRSQNYMPPEAAHAVEQAHKAAQSIKQ
ncbi:MAG: hypothetical protein ACOZCP_13040 [Pseudomonadota bacterium]